MSWSLTPPEGPSAMMPPSLGSYVNQGWLFNPAELEQLDKTAEKAFGSVCYVSTADPKRRGTGCIMFGGVLLSNYHVIDEENACHKDTRAIFFRVISQDGSKTETDIKIVSLELDPQKYFLACQNHIDPQTKTPLPPKEKHLDFTLVGLKSHPAISDGSVGFELFKRGSIQENDLACVIQHPETLDPKTLLKGDLKGGVGCIQKLYDFSAEYDTPTDQGSSGGAVINRNGEIIALHHQSRKSSNGWFTNSGVLFEKIVEHVRIHGGEKNQIFEKSLPVSSVGAQTASPRPLLMRVGSMEFYDQGLAMAYIKLKITK